ncbi:MAG: hypothetical protein J5I92_14795 [Thiogranum sp.]|nr:hypothetical protein [Thiogranum sp.]
MQIELVYEKTCPNIEAARTQLLRACAEAGISPHWQEWEVSNPEAPAHAHGYGSPTILVNGNDVSGDMIEGDDYCCRVYSHGELTNKGVPAVADIVRALRFGQKTAITTNPVSRWRLNGALLPTVGVALLPKLACPACWPAYAGVFSTVGIGFLDYTPLLLPLTAVFLLIAVTALAYRARQRRGYKPLLVGVLAAGTLLIGKFHYDSDVAMYAGLFLLVATSLWNTWPKSTSADTFCPACVTSGEEAMR